MALEFPNPVYPTWGQSVGQGFTQGFDSIMNAISRKKQQQQDDLLLAQQLGVDPKTLIQGMQLQRQGFQPGGQPMASTIGSPQPSPQAMPFMQPGANVQPSGGMQTGQGMTPNPLSVPQQPMQNPQQTGAYNTFQQWMQQNQARQALQGQIGQAQLGKEQSEAEKNTAEAQYYRNRPTTASGGSQNLPADQMAALRYGVETGLLAPSELTFRGPKTQILASGIMQRPDFQTWYAQQGQGPDKLAQNFNPMAADTKLSGMKSRASGQGSVQGRQGQQIGTMTGTLEDIIGKAKPLIAKLTPTDVAAVNNAFITGRAQLSNPDANRLLTYYKTMQGTYASILNNGNSPTESSRADAKQAIIQGLNSEGFEGMTQGLLDEGKSRTVRLMGQGYNEPNPLAKGSNPQDSQAVAWAKANPKDPRAKKILQINGQ